MTSITTVGIVCDCCVHIFKIAKVVQENNYSSCKRQYMHLFLFLDWFGPSMPKVWQPQWLIKCLRFPTITLSIANHKNKKVLLSRKGIKGISSKDRNGLLIQGRRIFREKKLEIYILHWKKLYFTVPPSKKWIWHW